MTRKSAEEIAQAAAEALVVIPMGAVALALYGWWGVLAFCVGWVMLPIAKAAYQSWKL